MALSTLPQISLSPVFDRCWLLGFPRKWFGGTSFSMAFVECKALPRAQQCKVDRYHADLRALQLSGATSAVCGRSSSVQGIFFLVELVLKRNGQHTVESCNCSFQSRFYSAQHWAWSRSLWILVLSNLSVKQDVSLKKTPFSLQHFIPDLLSCAPTGVNSDYTVSFWREPHQSNIVTNEGHDTALLATDSSAKSYCCHSW